MWHLFSLISTAGCILRSCWIFVVVFVVFLCILFNCKMFIYKKRKKWDIYITNGKIHPMYMLHFFVCFYFRHFLYLPQQRTETCATCLVRWINSFKHHFDKFSAISTIFYNLWIDACYDTIDQFPPV